MLILNCLLTVISRSEPQLTHFISALNAHVLRAKDLIAGLQRKLKSPYVCLEGGCLKHISDTKDLLLAGAFKIHV